MRPNVVTVVMPWKGGDAIGARLADRKGRACPRALKERRVRYEETYETRCTRSRCGAKDEAHHDCCTTGEIRKVNWIRATGRVNCCGLASEADCGMDATTRLGPAGVPILV
jgi:hypothetical protein